MPHDTSGKTVQYLWLKILILKRSEGNRCISSILYGIKESFRVEKIIESNRTSLCKSHTEKKPIWNIPVMEEKLVNNDSGIQSTQRYIDVFSIIKTENPLCKRLQW